MTVFALTGVSVSATPPSAWSLGGGAADYLDAVIADDAKYAAWQFTDSGVGLTYVIDATCEALSGVPTGSQVNLDCNVASGLIYVTLIHIRDAAGTTLAQWTGFERLSAGGNGFLLTQVYSGPVDNSADWQITVSGHGDVTFANLQLDWLNAEYSGLSGGGSGPGPGGARGPNAPILIPLMVQP